MALKKIDLSESAVGEEDPGAGIELTNKPPAGKSDPGTSQHDDEPVAAREPSSANNAADDDAQQDR